MRLALEVMAEDVRATSLQAQELERMLLDELPRAEVTRVRTAAETLDGGATLAVVLASPVLVELGRVVRAFLTRNTSAEITIKDANGSMVVKGVSAANAMEVFREYAAKEHDRRDS